MRFPRPDVQTIRHALPPERSPQPASVLTERVCFADRKRNVERTQLIEQARVGQIGNEMARRVKVDVLIVVTVKEAMIVRSRS